MGIQNIKVILLFLFNALNSALKIDANSDGKVGWREALAVFMPLAFDYERIADAVPELKAEFKDLTAEEIEELVQFANDNLDLDATHDQLERIIKRIINALHYNYRFITEMKSVLAGA